MTNHSMFPAHWDEARIRSEVTSAWESRQVDGDKWEGRSDSGVLIRGYTTPKGTAFPVYDE
ncbi:MAG: EndoU domain-containing protein [Moraxella sp.]|uniref:EndoU domain-containing protein n=1 Tax=Moraxella sp. TaxID=479 RepID=UPI0026DAAF3C|nr:EndoU domain-containing protein [Moraxella sp.]MDO4450544.1 EndoU domain-containing protein [Moraxella sp.]